MYIHGHDEQSFYKPHSSYTVAQISCEFRNLSYLATSYIHKASTILPL